VPVTVPREPRGRRQELLATVSYSIEARLMQQSDLYSTVATCMYMLKLQVASYNNRNTVETYPKEGS
jgi:hypothetical protein